MKALKIEYYIDTVSGVSVFAGGESLSADGVDKRTVKNPITGLPYIPGSSIRGKMRATLEELYELPSNMRIGNMSIHGCERSPICEVCNTFGLPVNNRNNKGRSLLIVRDAPLTDESQDKLLNTETAGGVYVEHKHETAVARAGKTGTGIRNFERIPADLSLIGEMVLTLGKNLTAESVRLLIIGLSLIEEIGLGNGTARGNGEIRIANIEANLLTREDIIKGSDGSAIFKYNNPKECLKDFDNWKNQIPISRSSR